MNSLNRRFFNERAATWNAAENRQKTDRLLEIFRQLHLPLRGPVLDVGCGTGILLPVLRRVLAEDAAVVELDSAREMLRHHVGRQYREVQPFAPVNGDALQLPFGPAVFQSVICFAVFPHLPDHGAALREIDRVLKPAGRLLILHLMGSAELNRMHSAAGMAVANDLLVPAAKLAQRLESRGFRVRETAENPDLYLILAEKPTFCR